MKKLKKGREKSWCQAATFFAANGDGLLSFSRLLKERFRFASFLHPIRPSVAVASDASRCGGRGVIRGSPVALPFRPALPCLPVIYLLFQRRPFPSSHRTDPFALGICSGQIVHHTAQQTERAHAYGCRVRDDGKVSVENDITRNVWSSRN